MPERLLQLDDLLNIRSPEKIATLFQKLGYDAAAQPLNIEDLHLPTCSTEVIYDSYLIADQGNGGLPSCRTWVLLSLTIFVIWIHQFLLVTV